MSNASLLRHSASIYGRLNIKIIGGNKMYFNILIWMHVLKGMQTFLAVALAGSIIWFLIRLVLYLMVSGDSCETEDWDEGFKKNIAGKRGLRRLITHGISVVLLIVILCFNLTPQKLLALYALKSVDNYNVSNTESMFEPEKILSVIDKTLEKVDGLLDKIE